MLCQSARIVKETFVRLYVFAEKNLRTQPFLQFKPLHGAGHFVWSVGHPSDAEAPLRGGRDPLTDYQQRTDAQLAARQARTSAIETSSQNDSRLLETIEQIQHHATPLNTSQYHSILT